MPIDFPCPSCGEILHAPENYAGGRGKCEHCGAEVRIPEVTDEPAAVIELAAAVQKAAASQPGAAPAAASEAPPAPPPAGSPPPSDRRFILWVLACVAIVLTALGGYAGYRVYRDWSVDEALQRIEAADRHVEDGKRRAAAEQLLPLKEKRLPADVAREVDSRLAELDDAVRAIEHERRSASQQTSDKQRKRRQESELAERQLRKRNLARVGGALVGTVYGAGMILLGFVWLGLAQMCTAFRDIAINSYLIANTTDDGTYRTPVPLGLRAPRYRFIPYFAGVFAVTGIMWVVGGAGLILFVIFA